MTTEIIIFCDIFPPPLIGGAERTVEILFQLLTKAGVKVSVHTIASQNQTKEIHKHRILNLYTPYVSKPPKLIRKIWHVLELYNPLEIVRCISILSKEQPKLVLCHNAFFWSWSPIFAANLLGIPSAIFVHDYGLICFRRTFWDSKMKQSCPSLCSICKIRRNKSKKILNLATFIFFNSNNTSGIFTRYFGKDALERKGKVVYPIQSVQIPILDSTSLNSVSEARSLGFIGRISPEKGVEDLLKVAKELKKEVHLAGDGEVEYIESLKRKFDSAVFLGHIPRNEFFFNQRIIVVPSKWLEPFGNVVTEALSAGKLVVIPNSGGFTEIANLLQPLIGNSIFIYDPDSFKSMKEAVLSAVKRSRKVALNSSRQYLSIPKFNLNNLVEFLTNYVKNS